MKVQVQPEVMRWVHDRLAEGRAPDLVQHDLEEVGWEARVADIIVKHALHAQPGPSSVEMTSVDTGSVLAQAASMPGGACAHGVPDIALVEQPVTLDLGDRQATVLLELKKPRVVVLGNFLAPEECQNLIDMARPRLGASRTVRANSTAEEINDDRTSRGMFFRRRENELIGRIEQRVARLLQWPEENCEGLQVLHYRPGQQYKAHHDYFDRRSPASDAILKRGGQRLATLIMYLNRPARGGGTAFTDVGLTVTPQVGSAIFFNYPTDTEDTLTRHAGLPVLEGEKWIATKWLRPERFD